MNARNNGPKRGHERWYIHSKSHISQLWNIRNLNFKSHWKNIDTNLRWSQRGDINIMNSRYFLWRHVGETGKWRWSGGCWSLPWMRWRKQKRPQVRQFCTWERNHIEKPNEKKNSTSQPHNKENSPSFLVFSTWLFFCSFPAGASSTNNGLTEGINISL